MAVEAGDAAVVTLVREGLRRQRAGRRLIGGVLGLLGSIGVAVLVAAGASGGANASDLVLPIVLLGAIVLVPAVLVLALGFRDPGRHPLVEALDQGSPVELVSLQYQRQVRGFDGRVTLALPDGRRYTFDLASADARTLAEKVGRAVRDVATPTMGESRLAARTDRLAAIEWSSAPAWRPEVAGWVHEAYARLLPFWPEDRPRLVPGDTALTERLAAALEPDERSRVDAAHREVMEAHTGRAMPARSTRALVWVALATSTLVDDGRLSAEEDPAEPLLDIFEAGYELLPHHTAADLSYREGLVTVRLPTRAEAMDYVEPRA